MGERVMYQRDFSYPCNARFQSVLVRHWMYVLVLLIKVAWVLGNQQSIVAEYPTAGKSSPPLNKMVVDGKSAVYVSAENNLYKLDTDLHELQSVETGPVKDNRACTSWENQETNKCVDFNGAELNLVDTKMINKVLLIDPNQRVLITCWNAFQGQCQIRQLSNISEVVKKNNGLEQAWAVPNDATSPAVAFFGPGPADLSENALYIGSSQPNDFDRQGTGEVFYVLSTRQVTGDNFFGIAHKDFFSSKGTFLHLVVDWKNFLSDTPKYVGGFTADIFNYFVMTQTRYTYDKQTSKFSKTSEYISKLGRVCGTDKLYISYVEMELVCYDSQGVKYNMVQDVTLAHPGKDLALGLGIQTSEYVLFATFTSTEEHSALCVYSLKDITQNFTENIQACFKGMGTVIPYYTNTLTYNCVADPPDFETVIDDNFCGIPHDNTRNNPIEGVIPIRAQPVMTVYNTKLTAVAVDTVSDHTVAFLGTSDGNMLKVLVKSATTSSQYDTVYLDTEKLILANLVFSSQHDYIYAMSQQKVYKVLIETCSHYLTCGECLNAKDPYCGWCTLENTCTRYSECQMASKELRWLSHYKSSPANQCVLITRVQPASAPRTGEPTQVTITVEQLPQNVGGYLCKFGVDSAIVMAQEMGENLVCETPLDKLPKIYDGKTTLNVTLSLKSLNTNIEFLSTSFTFYDCAKYKSCSSCASSTWGCRWCVHDNQCVDNRATCTSASGPIMDNLYCPRIEPSSPILLPSGQSRKIQLYAHNLPLPMASQGGYECIIHFSQPMRIPATREDSQRVTCGNTKYTYPSNEGEMEVSIKVLWNRNFSIDDNSGIKAIVYKCENMGTDCSLCNSLYTLQPKYGCMYCGNDCHYNATCNQPHNSNCPAPTVENVYPNTSPPQGGTKITIEGSNLGSRYSQVKSVSIGNVPCDLIEEEYMAAKRIVCITGQKNPSAASVVVQIGTATGEWKKDLFYYQEPELSQINPLKGPLSGGTRLTIMGSKLNTGLNIEAFLDEKPCTVLRDEVEPNAIICLTPMMPSLHTTSELAVKFDGYSKSIHVAYTYHHNPNVTFIDPLKSYASGGRVLTVKGENFKVINSPRIFARYNGLESSSSECSIVDDKEMLCRSPSVCQIPALSYLCVAKVATSTRRRRRQVVGDMVDLAFNMDGVESVKNLSAFFPDLASTLNVFPDPVYFNFSNGVREYKGESLQLNGKHLDLACTSKEVKVTIGGQPCLVYTLKNVSLWCRAPDKQPVGHDSQGNEVPDKLPTVEIRVGHLVWYPGVLKYQTELVYFPQGASIGIGVGGSILILIIIVILIVYKRKSSEAERQYKKMQIQLDTLESNVRNECKQAFAELQTEVSDLTSDLLVTGIPFWDYKTYTFKVLFPSHTDHPVLHRSTDITETKIGGYQQGLAQFNQLLNSKQFLLIFIRTLESQKNFSIRDKAQVASLLMIVLQDKMEYATEILKALLNELIDKSVEKKHPKLMLRRMESVVEKLLTNWMSICMYSYIKKHAGSSLYMLYKAIKQQTEKGPVDAITSEARYSLSEDRLLREKIDHKVLNINLVVEGQPSDPVSCRVLDCDSITQAKEKALDAVYMNTPFSRRPSVFDVDLALISPSASLKRSSSHEEEWRSGRSGHLPLQDEDVTTELIRGWKRVNTLAHYHVPDGATMALVPKRNKNDYVRQVHGMIEITGGGSLSNLGPIVTIEEGTKVWHLVKHDDGQNLSRTQKVISEIFLTRLLATKGTIQQFVDDLFRTVLKVDNTLPPAIKYLFDFLDQAARRHNIVDAEVVHTWKSNSLPLRFWVNIIKNPEFVFDIHKSHITDSCLSVIAQTFMDSCSTSEHRLGKDSPSNKLLFAKDITKYRKWVEKYYRDIQEMPPVTDYDMNRTMTELSMSNMVDFNVSCALKELYRYATQYNFELLEALDDDTSAKKLHLANKFEQVTSMLEGSPLY